MLVRLFAGEIIMGRITEDDVPAKLKARVHKYLVDMGYFDDVEEYLITYAGKSLGEKISRNRHRLDADGNPLPDPSGDTLNNEEAQG